MQQLHQRHALTANTTGTVLPRAYAVYANAQFGVTRDRIWRRPREFYERLLSEFEGEDAGACFRMPSPPPAGGALAPGSSRLSPRTRTHRGTCMLLEFLWPTVFGEPPVLDPRRTMSGERADHQRGPSGTIRA
mmetsp:Transcript_15686/g.40516  ORF Transcript_15686/g.40516 Transcript_15686/m.40516 type:complete len:133 (+) Transcript_15686:37-435(+)